MTTATVPNATGENAVSAFLNRHQFALRRVHSLTGLVFGGYVVVHLLVNATLIEGLRYGSHDIYQGQVDTIHSLPFLMAVEWLFILLPIIFHALYGIVIMVAGRPNVSNYGYGKNWAYLLQRISAVILIFFIAFHYLSMKGAFGGELGAALTFVPAQATQTTINHMHAAWWVGWVVYPIGILTATFHLANGFWTAGVTWGVTITASSQRLWAYACVGLFLFTFACGMISLGATLAGEPGPIPTAAQEVQEERVGQKGTDYQGPGDPDPIEEELPGE